MKHGTNIPLMWVKRTLQVVCPFFFNPKSDFYAFRDVGVKKKVNWV